MKKNISEIDEFMKLKSFAIIGVSAKKKKFGNIIYKQLLRKGLKIYPIHRNAMLIDGTPCYPDISNLPEKPDGVILNIHPEETEKALKDIFTKGIKHVWMQQGSENKAAIEYCKSNGIKAVTGNCILMFLEKPGFPHNFHHWVWGMRS